MVEKGLSHQERMHSDSRATCETAPFSVSAGLTRSHYFATVIEREALFLNSSFRPWGVRALPGEPVLGM